jgi:hypothetical protein
MPPQKMGPNSGKANSEAGIAAAAAAVSLQTTDALWFSYMMVKMAFSNAKNKFSTKLPQKKTAEFFTRCIMSYLGHRRKSDNLAKEGGVNVQQSGDEDADWVGIIAQTDGNRVDENRNQKTSSGALEDHANKFVDQWGVRRKVLEKLAS